MIRRAMILAALLASSCATPGTAPVYTMMPDGPLVAAPAGWIDYCRRHAADDVGCRMPIPAIAVGLTPHRLAQLRGTQREMLSIRRVSDAARGHATDYWEVATDSGDCEDIALAARKRLVEQGWPLGALRMAMAITETGDGHAVLAVDVMQDGHAETLILDSRFGQPIPWDNLVRLGYFFTERQSPTSLDWAIVANGIGMERGR